MRRTAAFLLALWIVPAAAAAAPGDADVTKAVADGVRLLVKVQEDGGAWPYQGVYGAKDEKGEYVPPIGYRVGGTAICALALLHAADPADADAAKAIAAGVDCVLKGLDDPLMTAAFEKTYDVRIWGHAYALLLFCRLQAEKREGERAKEIAARIPWLVEAIEKTEIPGGGWNYARPKGANEPGPSSPFTTAPVLQALLEAKARGAKVDEGILERAKRTLLDARTEEGGFVYAGKSGGGGRGESRAKVPGAIARMPIAETTLRLFGGGSVEATRKSVEAFFEHWAELEARRKKTGTHEGPYGIAPYYFFYGHYYAAQAIESLPEGDRPALRKRLLAILFKIREADGSWNDRVFDRSKNFGTAMVMLAMLAPKLPAPSGLAPAPATAGK